MAGLTMDKCLHVLSFLVLIGLAAAKPSPNVVNVLDDNEIEFVAGTVCEVTEGSDWQIGRISTIIQLDHFFSTIQPGHKLRDCRERYYHILEKLSDLVRTNNDDVCGKKKIDDITSFYENFVSRAGTKRFIDKPDAPRILVLFFLHYVYEVGSICKMSLIQQLDSSEANEMEFELASKQEELKELDRYIGDASALTGGTSKSLKNLYSITIPFWSVVDNLHSKKLDLDLDSDYFAEPTRSNDYKRAYFATSDYDRATEFQRECKRFKSVYESPVLAIVRLTNLGFYLNDEPFAKELVQRPSLRRLIGAVMICEFILPIGLVEDKSLDKDEFVMVKIEKAKELGYYESDGQKIEPPSEVKGKYLARQSWFSGFDNLSSVTPTTAAPFIKNLKANIRDREQFFLRSMKGYVGATKLKIKSWIGKMFGKKKDLFPFRMFPIFNLLD